MKKNLNYNLLSKNQRYNMERDNEYLDSLIRNPRGKVDHIQKPVYMQGHRAVSVGRPPRHKSDMDLDLTNIEMFSKLYSTVNDQDPEQEQRKQITRILTAERRAQSRTKHINPYKNVREEKRIETDNKFMLERLLKSRPYVMTRQEALQDYKRHIKISKHMQQFGRDQDRVNKTFTAHEYDPMHDVFQYPNITTVSSNKRGPHYKLPSLGLPQSMMVEATSNGPVAQSFLITGGYSTVDGTQTGMWEKQGERPATSNGRAKMSSEQKTRRVGGTYTTRGVGVGTPSKERPNTRPVEITETTLESGLGTAVYTNNNNYSDHTRVTEYDGVREGEASQRDVDEIIEERDNTTKGGKSIRESINTYDPNASVSVGGEIREKIEGSGDAYGEDHDESFQNLNTVEERLAYLEKLKQSQLLIFVLV
eukprot:TRINITY_DN11784_c0_g1_i1.p1 TRINITY_DN11784_c0_g1~~TRINITY_DN11784_c0_g1_i1.p1  ORF type:complete len:421 (-),score=45.31 TRINITY_DN11784_c0_g1_i1:43-1305(-)